MITLATLCQRGSAGVNYSQDPVSVCTVSETVSVTSRCSIETSGRIELVLDFNVSFRLPHTVS